MVTCTCPPQKEIPSTMRVEVFPPAVNNTIDGSKIVLFHKECPLHGYTDITTPPKEITTDE